MFLTFSPGVSGHACCRVRVSRLSHPLISDLCSALKCLSVKRLTWDALTSESVITIHGITRTSFFCELLLDDALQNNKTNYFKQSLSLTEHFACLELLLVTNSSNNIGSFIIR